MHGNLHTCQSGKPGWFAGIYIPGEIKTGIRTLSGFPSGEAGYELGVSACYSGFIGDYLIVAGGCNFPEPGKKKYYSGIYAAKVTGNEETLHWKMIGHLPEPAAYGGVVTSGDSLVLVGGCNTEHSLKTVLSIHLDKKSGKPILKSLPALPCTVDNMGVCLMDNRLFVVGVIRMGILPLPFSPVNSERIWNGKRKRK